MRVSVETVTGQPVEDKTPTVTIGIVEDDELLRESLTLMLECVEGFVVGGAVGTLAEGLGLLDARLDLLLVDLGLPDGSGLDLIANVRSRDLACKVLVLTVFADVRSVVAAIEEGADGYLLKQSEPDEVLGAIRTVLAGGAPISPAVASHILARMRSASAPKQRDSTVSLTVKETAVLEALASGRSFKEVAAQQSISLHTVGDHVKAIYRKLSVNSRGEAVFKAVQSGLINIKL